MSSASALHEERQLSDIKPTASNVHHRKELMADLVQSVVDRLEREAEELADFLRGLRDPDRPRLPRHTTAARADSTQPLRLREERIIFAYLRQASDPSTLRILSQEEGGASRVQGLSSIRRSS